MIKLVKIILTVKFNSPVIFRTKQVQIHSVSTHFTALTLTIVVGFISALGLGRHPFNGIPYNICRNIKIKTYLPSGEVDV